MGGGFMASGEVPRSSSTCGPRWRGGWRPQLRSGQHTVSTNTLLGVCRGLQRDREQHQGQALRPETELATTTEEFASGSGLVGHIAEESLECGEAPTSSLACGPRRAVVDEAVVQSIEGLLSDTGVTGFEADGQAARPQTQQRPLQPVQQRIDPADLLPYTQQEFHTYYVVQQGYSTSAVQAWWRRSAPISPIEADLVRLAAASTGLEQNVANTIHEFIQASLRASGPGGRASGESQSTMDERASRANPDSEPLRDPGRRQRKRTFSAGMTSTVCDWFLLSGTAR